MVNCYIGGHSAQQLLPAIRSASAFPSARELSALKWRCPSFLGLGANRLSYLSFVGNRTYKASCEKLSYAVVTLSEKMLFWGHTTTTGSPRGRREVILSRVLLLVGGPPCARCILTWPLYHSDRVSTRSRNDVLMFLPACLSPPPVLRATLYFLLGIGYLLGTTGVASSGRFFNYHGDHRDESVATRAQLSAPPDVGV